MHLLIDSDGSKGGGTDDKDKAPRFERLMASAFRYDTLDDMPTPQKQKRRKPRHHRTFLERNIHENINMEAEEPLKYTTADTIIFC